MTATDTRPNAALSPPGAGSAGGQRFRMRQYLAYLPTGHRLGEKSFASRHNLAVVVAAGLFVFVLVIGVVTGEDLDHIALEMAPMAVAVVVGSRAAHRDIAIWSVVFALMSASSLLIHFTGGLIESHFLFFVLLPLVALYQDWRAFLGAIGFVVFHHAVIGTLAPEAVYNHESAINNPVKWGIIHAVFVVALVVVLVVEWNFAEAAQKLAKERLTDLQIAQAELVQAQKLESVGQLAAGIAHEINTPMQYIGDNTHFLKATVTRLLNVAAAAELAIADDATDDDREALRSALDKSKLRMLSERAPKAADDALVGVDNVSRIVAAMKRFSHPGSDEMEPLDINEAIATTMTVCRNEWKYSAEITTNFEDGLPLVEGKLGPLNQVWLNMIVNATHAIADRHGDVKGLITITTSAVRGRSAVQISIADNGAGISEANLARVFDHFFTTKEVGKGSGQGLAIAHQIIVGEHDGTLTVASTPDVGTTFTIVLPTTQGVGAS